MAVLPCPHGLCLIALILTAPRQAPEHNLSEAQAGHGILLQDYGGERGRGDL